MANIFISYSSSDRRVVSELDRGLKSLGWSVWWDRYIQAGQRADAVILGELEEARAVVVLWSNDSVTSRWVLDEADIAIGTEKLVPIRIGDVQPPIGFRRLQFLDFSTWTYPNFSKFERTICVICISFAIACHHGCYITLLPSSMSPSVANLLQI